MKNLSYRQLLFLLLAVFASGAVVGGFAASLYQARTVSAVAPATPQAWRDKYVRDLTGRLRLDGEQVGKLNSILDETRSRYDAVKLRYKPEMDRIHDEQIASIRNMLSGGQASEYDKFRDERDRERKKAQQQQAAAAGSPKK